MYLGLDLGTSGLKGLIIDDNQNPVASATSSLTVSRPQSGWSEQDPNSWITACQDVLGALRAEIDLANVKAIGLSGQMHGATVLDAEDQPIWPSILWNDARAAAEARWMDEQASFRAATGNIVFPGFTAPKVEWLRQHQMPIFEKMAKILLPKDYLRLWLTGEHVSDMSDAAGTSWLDTGARAWSSDLLNACQLRPNQMPTLVEGAEVSGTLRTEIANAFGFGPHVKVAGGAGDNAASAVGVGVVSEGDAFVSLGTSGVLFAANSGYRPAPETAVHTFCHALPDTWHQMGVILAATDALSWLAQILKTSPADLTSGLGDLAAPSRALFFPYLGGERTPINDADIRGAFLGLEHATDGGALTRAVLEGVCFALLDCQRALEATGTRFDQLLAVGGGSQSRYWLSALATALGKVIAVPKGSELGGAFGAARLAIMCDTGAGVDVAQKPDIEAVIEPQTALSSAFADGFERYQSARDAIGALSSP